MKEQLEETSTTLGAVTIDDTASSSDPAKILSTDTFAHVLSFCPASMFYTARRVSRQWKRVADSVSPMIFLGGREYFEEMCGVYGPAYKKVVLNGLFPPNIDRACEAFMSMSLEEKKHLLSPRCVELLKEPITTCGDDLLSPLDMHIPLKDEMVALLSNAAFSGLVRKEGDEMDVFYKALFLGLVREEDLEVFIFNASESYKFFGKKRLLLQIIDYSSVKNKIVPYELMRQIWHGDNSLLYGKILEQFRSIEEATKKGLLTYEQLKNLDLEHLKSLLFSRYALVALNEGLITIEQFKSIPKEPNLNELFPNLLDSNDRFIINIGPSANVIKLMREKKVTADELSCTDYNNKRQLMTYGREFFNIEGISSTIGEILQQIR